MAKGGTPPKAGAQSTSNAEGSSEGLPKILGGYELLERVGHGGMGIVYRARQVSLDRIVAVKLLPPGALLDKAQVHRFRTEAAAAGSLQHPNIVAIHEVGLCEEQHYLVMDYVEGPTLAELARVGPLPPMRAARYVRAIAEAVHHAHEHGILHRDLKPSNILIDGSDEPRVTDFGLAKRLESGTNLTLSGEVLGSPQYMPPEQAVGRQQQVGRRSDVYSLGAILYHLLTGRPPFLGETVSEILPQVTNEEPLSPRQLNPAVPPDLETICLKCLEKEPARRYSTALALSEELGRYLHGEQVLARAVGPAGKCWRWTRRNPRLASAIGIAVLALLLGIAGVSWQWRQTVSERNRAEAGELLARRHAYAADMRQVQHSLQDNDLGRAQELLVRYLPDPKAGARNLNGDADLRGWEWRYLWSRCQSDEHQTLCHYSNSVSALAFSADGRWLAIRREDGPVTLWDATAQQVKIELPGAWGYKALAFSPRGSCLAWGNTKADGTPMVSLWDAEAGRDIGQLISPTNAAPVVTIVFSPDAKALATLAYDGIVCLWDLESRNIVRSHCTPRLDWGGTFNFGMGGESPETEEPLRTAPIFSNHYGCLGFSPDGRWLVIGDAKTRIHLLDRTSGAEREFQLESPASGISAMAISPDGKLLALAGGVADPDIHLWDPTTRTEISPLVGHRRWIAGLAFSPDGRRLASASADQTVRVWDVERGIEQQRFQGFTQEIWAVAWARDEKNLLLGGRDGTVRSWDPAQPTTPAYEVLPAQIRPWGLAISPDSKSLVGVRAKGGAIVRWDATSLRELETLSFVGTNHMSLALSPDGRRLALAPASGNVQVWDLETRRLVNTLSFTNTMVFILRFTAHGNILGAGGYNPYTGYALKMWRTATWEVVSTKGIDTRNHGAGEASPDERTFALTYRDGTVAWWNLATGQKMAHFDRQSSGGVRPAFSADGSRFALGWDGGRIAVWNARTLQPKARFHEREFIYQIVLSPDGCRLAATWSGMNEVVKMWDVETGREVATLPGLTRYCPTIGFSPDGNTLYAASLEGTVLLWHAPTFAEIENAERNERLR